jgi:hypothetical protein
MRLPQLIECFKYITLFRALLDASTKSGREECIIYFAVYTGILELLSVIFADPSGKYHPGFMQNFEAMRQHIGSTL